MTRGEAGLANTAVGRPATFEVRELSRTTEYAPRPGACYRLSAVMFEFGDTLTR